MADHPALTRLIFYNLADSPKDDRVVAERVLAELEPLFRQQWEDELLSDEAVEAGARGFAEGFSLPNHPCRTKLVLRAALAATKKGGE